LNYFRITVARLQEDLGISWTFQYILAPAGAICTRWRVICDLTSDLFATVCIPVLFSDL
jgi:hypothetical protein